MIYTGIGSRSVPSDVFSVMRRFAYMVSELQWVLRSGGANGADSAFEQGCRDHAESIGCTPAMNIYLPWEGFNGRTTKDGNFPCYHVGVSSEEDRAMKLAAKHHPAWDRCSRMAKQFHARNCFQILGLDLESETDIVVCWTPEGKRGGGTGQALRLAESLDIPIIDLGEEYEMSYTTTEDNARDLINQVKEIVE